MIRLIELAAPCHRRLYCRVWRARGRAGRVPWPVCLRRSGRSLDPSLCFHCSWVPWRGSAKSSPWWPSRRSNTRKPPEAWPGSAWYRRSDHRLRSATLPPSAVPFDAATWTSGSLQNRWISGQWIFNEFLMNFKRILLDKNSVITNNSS